MRDEAREVLERKIAVVGSEEIYPNIADAGRLARAIGAPYLPITPTFP